jgi:hypothetical protein
LAAAQKAKLMDVAGCMLQTLESHTAFNLHFLWTGDEPWMFCECYHEIMSAASWEEVDELDWPTHYHRKTMVTTFSNGKGKYIMDMLARSQSMDISRLTGEIIGGL